MRRARRPSGGAASQTTAVRVLTASLLAAGLCPTTVGCGDAAATDAGSDGVGGDTMHDGQRRDGADLDGGAHDEGTDDGGVPLCIAASGSGSADSSRYPPTADPYQAQVTIGGGGCARSYQLSTSAPLRDGLPANPRSFDEPADAPVVRTRNDIVDALYALAQVELRENAVSSISDGAFDDGAPIACPAGGCFETGRLWHYVWTRDTAYAAHLALAALDPLRTRNSLEFKLSQRRGGGDEQVVQDTGSGGSYPVSSDRVAWALGAWELLKYLDGAERLAFGDRAYAALRDTAEHDREVVFDAADGLYRGEQSFLDWREQSYPGWTAGDVAHLGMSKALSTNTLHLRCLEVVAALADERGEAAVAAKFSGWAAALRTAIHQRFYLDDAQRYSSFATTTLDQAPTRRFDLLGTALAVIFDLGQAAEGSAVVSSYPHLPRGAPVIWPQQQDVPIYHNRAIWPFVSAYWLKAARRVGHHAAIEHAVRSLLRGAALNLSAMENLEAVSGLAWVDDGPLSGPVVNSQRQLWSVAALLSMVHEVFFGLEATQQGIRFRPALTKGLRRTLFAGADTLVLNNFPYRGRAVSVVVSLPAASAGEGIYEVGAVRLNGASVAADQLFGVEQLAARNLVEVELVEGAASTAELLQVDPAGGVEALFGPRTPTVTGVDVAAGKLVVSFAVAGENPAAIVFDIFRDGARVAAGIAGSASSWTDPTSAGAASPSHCYSVAARYVSSGNSSQHAAPVCYWGASGERVQSVQAGDFVATGGTLVNNHGRWHYEAWGDPGHRLEVPSFSPQTSGAHLLQVVYGNGAGPVDTGVTCGVKRLEVRELPGDQVVASGQLLMPHLGSWDRWEDSSFVRADLDAAKAYRIVIGEDARSVNMSVFKHFERYTGGLGGSSGTFNRVNIAELKILALDP